MKATIRAEAVGDTQITVTLTATLREWRYARDQFNQAAITAHEATQVTNAVKDAVALMETKYYVEPPS